MDFRILGPLEVISGERVLPLSARRQRVLLAMLVLHANQAVSVEHLIDAIWGERPPPSAINLVQGYVGELRKLLEPQRLPRSSGEVLVTSSAGYLLHVPWQEIDAYRFEQLCGQARQALPLRPDAAASLYRDALALWRGRALGELAQEPFARGEAARLEEQRILAVEGRIDADLRLGRPAELVGELKSLVREYPLRERLRGQLMLALYGSGRQVEALHAYTEGRQTLGEELGLEPGPELQQLERAILSHDLVTPAAVEPNPEASNNLPAQLTSFVGRAAELAQLRRLLLGERLVTLTGAGGSGKSRLALEVAQSFLRGAFEQVWYVDFTALRNPELVGQAVAEAMGVREESGRALSLTLAEYLRYRRTFIVFDNCEHLVDACARLAEELIRSCPQLRILAASRQPLFVPGEVTYLVPGLSLPSPGVPMPLAETESYEAINLFLQRARAALPGFKLTEANAQAIVQICRRLDGLPLGIELAASAARVLSPEQIAERLRNRFSLEGHERGTVDARHKTLRAAIDWSYELLTEPERRLFARLSVFAGTFTLEAAEAIGADSKTESEQPIVTSLARLVSQSLILREEDVDGEARFRLLETLQQYAHERLEQSGESTSVRRRHAHFFLTLAEEADRHVRGPRSSEWIDRLERDQDNFRSALEWFFDLESGDGGARLAAALSWPWRLRGRLDEMGAWLNKALQFTPDAEPAVMARVFWGISGIAVAQGDFDRAAAASERHWRLAKAAGDDAQAGTALLIKAMTAWAQGNYKEAQSLCKEALAMVRKAGDQQMLAIGLTIAGRAAQSEGKWEQAKQLLDEAVAVAETRGESMALAFALDVRCSVALAGGDLDGAAEFCERSLSHYRRVGYQEGIASALSARALIAQRRGDVEAAEEALIQSLSLCLRLSHRGGIAHALEGLGRAARVRGQLANAARLFSSAAALRSAVGVLVPPHQQEECEQELGAIRAGLGSEEFAQRWAEGRLLRPEEVLEATRDEE